MVELEKSNKPFEQAVAFVNFTKRNLFLTGKAGTGKTTFLRYIKDNCSKKLAVLAPTGVAAINAGGVTIHSFFQMPFGIFAPTSQHIWGTGDHHQVFNRHQLLEKLRFNSAKKSLMQELEMLIIDEVSMVRADLLDAIDTILRSVRRKPELPFGGIQMIFIGDLFQLPPVVRNEDMPLINQFYKSPFFFDAFALQEQPPVYLELNRIYRQSNAAFISLLNKVRNNQIHQVDLDALNQYYQPDFEPKANDNYITLASHNAIADQINQKALDALPGKSYRFKASIEGEFPERSFPADKEIVLKKGAQVMFIKNDKGEQRKFYNGKIGIIASIDTNKDIHIRFKDEPELFLLEKETWQNLRYDYDQEKDRVEEMELGSFAQFPIRLAWAITIHKSQGLTFEKAVIDAGRSFAPGQVYVALSRLTGLQGLVLRSKIFASSISTNSFVLDYCLSDTKGEDALQEVLEEEQRHYVYALIIEAFDWGKLYGQLSDYIEENQQKMFNEHQNVLDKIKEIFTRIGQQNETSRKFMLQLETLIEKANTDGFEGLHQRTHAACGWFSEALTAEIIQPLRDQLKALKSVKKTGTMQKKLIGLIIPLERKAVQIKQVLGVTEAMCQSENTSDWLQSISQLHRVNVTDSVAGLKPATRMPVGETKRITLEMFNAGMTVTEIASERKLATGTIESHLVSFIGSGQVDLGVFVSDAENELISKIMDENPEITASEIRKMTEDKVSFPQIRAVAAARDAKPKDAAVSSK